MGKKKQTCRSRMIAQETSPLLPIRRSLRILAQKTSRLLPIRRSSRIFAQDNSPLLPIRRSSRILAQETSPLLPIRRSSRILAQETSRLLPIRRSSRTLKMKAVEEKGGRGGYASLALDDGSTCPSPKKKSRKMKEPGADATPRKKQMLCQVFIGRKRKQGKLGVDERNAAKTTKNFGSFGAGTSGNSTSSSFELLGGTDNLMSVPIECAIS